MKRRIFTTALLLSSAVICFATIGDITGKWSGVIKMDDGSEIPLTYNFKADGAKLTGTVKSSMGEFQLNDGKIKGDSVMFDVDYNGTPIPNTGRVYADSLTLDVTLNDAKFHEVLKKADK